MTRRGRPGALAAMLLGAALACAQPGPGRAQQQGAEQGPDQVPLATIRQQAETGDAQAQYDLARRHDRGLGMPQDFVAAALWAERAAQQGHRAAQNLLGRYYHSGRGGRDGRAEAELWLSRAAETGDPQYLFDLASALETPREGAPDMARAARLYGQAAEAGHLEATVSLGVLYQEGLGVERDAEAARALYETAAAQGHARAQNNLGLLYVRGDGVDRDYEAAAALFTRAGQAGLAEAVRNLGVLHENGFGVAQDDAKAAALYRQAAALVRPDTAALTPLMRDPRLAEPGPDRLAALARAARAGDPVAQHLAGWLIVSGRTPGSARDAARWFGRAADKGHGPSMTNLGLMYFKGAGLPQDYVLGYMWLSLAVAAGDDAAAVLVESLLPQLTGDQLAEAQQRAGARWDRIAR